VSKVEYLWFRLIADRGQTLAEYGILVAVIAVVVILAAVVLGGSITALFGKSANKV
jgi:Flp pilus assembly pilin Flp